MFDQIKRGEIETIIGPTVRVEGNFTGAGDVIIEGQLTGTLKTDKSVRIGERAKVKADVQGNDVFVAGEVHGNVKAAGKLELAASARVIGNIETASLTIAAGAVLHGRCVMAGHGEVAPEVNPAPAKKAPREGA